MSFVPSGIAAKFYNVSDTSLRKWADDGKIEYKETAGGHRRYKLGSVDGEIEEEDEDVRKSIIYARVSSFKQKNDLEHQIEMLRALYPEHDLITDIGSGLNYSRKGLKKILDQVLAGNIKEVVVAYKDRFMRFGYEFVEEIFSRFNTQLICVESKEESSDEQELAEDIIAITTFFSARYHGRRSYTDKQKSTVIIKPKTKKVI